jgi:hypothetical protein
MRRIIHTCFLEASFITRCDERWTICLLDGVGEARHIRVDARCLTICGGVGGKRIDVEGKLKDEFYITCLYPMEHTQCCILNAPQT